MKAFFPAGGAGEGLEPLTAYTPGPMLPIMGRPLLQRSCEALAACGVTDAVLDPRHLPRGFHFSPDGAWGLKVHHTTGRTPTDLGDAIRSAGHHWDDTFFVLGAGTLCGLSLEGMLAHHRQMQADVTIAAATSRAKWGSDGYVTGFDDEPTDDAPGAYIFEPDVLGHIPAEGPAPLESGLFPRLLAAGRPVALYRDDACLAAIDTPRRYVQAHRDIFDGLCGVAETPTGGAWLDETADIAGSVLCDNRVFAGRNSAVGDASILGQYVVVGDGARVAPGCYLDDVILWPGAHVPSGTLLQHCVALCRGGRLLQLPYSQLGAGPLRENASAFARANTEGTPQ